MISIVAYILFFAIWFYALNRSISHSGIATHINLQTSIHWLQVLFWGTVCIILLGSMVVLLTENVGFVSVTFFGVFFEWLIIVGIFLQIGWDERAMIYRKYNESYFQLPRTPQTVLALEKTEKGKGNYILYLILGGLGIVLGFIYGEWFYPVSLCSLSIASAMVTSHCRFLQYAAVTQSELIVRYGIPPFCVHKINLKKMRQADPQAQKNRIQLTVADDNSSFMLNLPPESDVARIVASHLTKS